MPIFDDLKSLFQRQIISERMIMAFFGVGGALGLSLPVLLPSQDREAKLFEHIYGVGSFVALTAAAWLRQTDERIYNSINEARLKSLKSKMQHQFAFDNSVNSIESLRELTAYISTLPEHEQNRWVAQFGLQGLIEPYLQPMQPTPIKVKEKVREPQVVTLSDDEVRSVTNPAASNVLESLATEFPGIVRIDGRWIDEVCEQSSNHDMTKRFNHHFCFAGGTQSGKSTLAGVIINKIGARSQSPILNIGHDPKDGVTRWLCKFSKLFNGMERCSDWIRYATSIVDKRKSEVEKIGGACTGLGEIFFLQDEVDTVYGRGKGFPGKITKDQALELQALWNYFIKFTAGLKCHGIFMCQSPLSEANGFSRADLKNICFIAVGATASYILDNPKDFINVDKDTLNALRTACSVCEEAGLRYALVVPTRGKPFVGVIPTFDIPGAEKQISEPFSDTPKAETTEGRDWYEEIALWYDSLSIAPTMQELQTKWYQLTGMEIDEDGVRLLLEAMITKRGMAT